MPLNLGSSLVNTPPASGSTACIGRVDSQVASPDGVQQPAECIDRVAHGAMAHLSGGFSPAALALAYWDWALHLAFSPGKQVQLLGKAASKVTRLAYQTFQLAPPGDKCEPCIDPLPQDRRFEDEVWQVWPYSLVYQSFLLQQQWWHNAT
ncbi:MAG TPA: poly-beta-hydroxybutyrate polymerase N-terminal domain-containing protein, partial [Microvirga sp.]|nr:poly-beta-hydroxybutyrate polymerase N-terminal domain-containing protein [Microvirga sp.]